jgi:hypothetical protein
VRGGREGDLEPHPLERVADHLPADGVQTLVRDVERVEVDRLPLLGDGHDAEGDRIDL